MRDVLRPVLADAIAAWAALVRANREQAERVAEPVASGDFYAPIAPAFRPERVRTEDPALAFLLGLAIPGETWLDIGAGGGRNALPLARAVREVIAIEPSPAMRAVLEAAVRDDALENVRVLDARWPMEDPAMADVALISHVGYDVEEIGPFLDAMEGAARRLCVAVLLEDSPPAPAAAFWPAIHGEERRLLPALPEFLALQLARGRLCEVRLVEREPVSWPRDGLRNWLRQQLFLAPGSDLDRKLEDLSNAVLEEREGRWAASWERKVVGIVSWKPFGEA